MILVARLQFEVSEKVCLRSFDALAPGHFLQEPLSSHEGHLKRLDDNLVQFPGFGIGYANPIGTEYQRML